jgi:hypothetical protein
VKRRKCIRRTAELFLRGDALLSGDSGATDKASNTQVVEGVIAVKSPRVQVEILGSNTVNWSPKV